MENNILVSVIVPAYNVEKYINHCIESILAQTYRNIEVIIVDDGSKDNTGKILDAIAHVDTRVIVKHISNSGVSVARNTGVELSNGEYVIFVDADDYLAEDCIEYMLNLVRTTNAEFCVSRNCFTRKDETQVSEDVIETLTPEDALITLLSPQIIVGCWNKIYKKSLLIDNNISFNKDLFYGEGLSFITTIAQLTNCVGIGNRKVYYYRRNNVASATTKFDIEKLINGEKSLISIRNNFLIKTKRVYDMWEHHMCLYSLGAVVRIKTFNLEKRYHEQYRHWNKILRDNAFKFIFNKDLSLYRKLLLIGGWFSPWLLAKMDIKRRDKIVKESIDG